MAFKLSTGLVRIPIERDDEAVGTIVFNPADTTFREKVIVLYQDATKKKDEWAARAAEVDALPDGESNTPEGIKKLAAINALEKESFAYIQSIIDDLFGAGSGLIVFGDKPLDVDTTGNLFLQFMQQAVTPHLNKHVQDKRAKYVK